MIYWNEQIGQALVAVAHVDDVDICSLETHIPTHLIESDLFSKDHELQTFWPWLMSVHANWCQHSLSLSPSPSLTHSYSLISRSRKKSSLNSCALIYSAWGKRCKKQARQGRDIKNAIYQIMSLSSFSFCQWWAATTRRFLLGQAVQWFRQTLERGVEDTQNTRGRRLRGGSEKEKRTTERRGH